MNGTPTIHVNGKNPQVDIQGEQGAWWRAIGSEDLDAWKKAIEQAAAS